MEAGATRRNEVDLVELQFLVSKLTSIIDNLQTDSSKHNILLRKLTGLPQKLEGIKLALASSNGDNSLKKDSLYRIKNVLLEWESHPNRLSFFSSLVIHRFLSKITTLIRLELVPQQPVGNVTGKKEINPQNQALRIMDVDRWFPDLTTRTPDANVHGIEDKISSLVRLLSLRRENDGKEFRAFGISGLRGVGKTMLCQQVFGHKTVQSYFLPRIWVCLSKKEDDDDKNHRTIVVKRILEAIGVEEDLISFAETKQKLEGLLYLLRHQLMGKNYLIVLDDAWKEDDEEFFSGLNEDSNLSPKLAYGLPKGYGGAILINSRSEEMANFMVGSEGTLGLTSNLDSESCWLIFKEEAEKKHALSKELVDLKGEIIKNCDGLPLAAKLLGELVQ